MKNRELDKTPEFPAPRKQSNHLITGPIIRTVNFVFIHQRNGISIWTSLTDKVYFDSTTRQRNNKKRPFVIGNQGVL